ncbi:MAG TPA: GDSL-type esterase/lipase family protein [archaeon]|nr:GDSL-type esterase/lipase family protein [archaeon]
MVKILFILTLLIISVSCIKEQAPPERAVRLARESLKMVRLEQQAMLKGTDLESEAKAADKLFLETLKLDPSGVKTFVETGAGPCTEQLEGFLNAAGKLKAPYSRNDPAAVISRILAETPETASRTLFLTEGYAAVFQMVLEVERDGTVVQDFIPFILALGCPVTFRDLGLEQAGRQRLEELAAQMSSRTRKMPYSTGPFDYFITLVKIDSWASKFSGQITADTLADRLLITPGVARLIPRLKSLPPARLGFLGDSNMDRIHWSTQGPFPDIIAAVFSQVNPSVTVINAGKGGDDSGEALARIDRDLISKKPQISFVMLGGNDCRHWGRPDPAVTPGQYRVNMTEIVNRLREAGSRVVLLGYPQGPELSGADLEVFRGISRELVSIKDSLATGWIDLAATITQGDKERLYAVDRIHFSPEGHLLIAGKILEYLSRQP